MIFQALSRRLFQPGPGQVVIHLSPQLLSLGRGQMAQQIGTRLETLIPTTLPVTLADIRRVRRLARLYPGLKARDLVHAAVMIENGLSRILSTDRHFDLMNEIERIDPRDLRVGKASN